jgi:hypothetical protein
MTRTASGAKRIASEGKLCGATIQPKARRFHHGCQGEESRILSRVIARLALALDPGGAPEIQTRYRTPA